MNLDVNGMGEGAGYWKVAGEREVMEGGWKATVIHKLYFGNLYLLNKSLKKPLHS